ncbi:MAG TPA: TerC family protein, partial [Candidatus Methylacidiphilales bacterium]
LSLWIGFNALLLALMGADMALFRRTDRPAGTGRLVLTTLVWIAVAIGFGLWIGHRAGGGKSLEFFTGYVIEYALSIDNIFIFVLVFASFKIAADQQHRLLFWGVLGALVMRGLMIWCGAALLHQFEWVIYLFGAYILYAGVAMLMHKKDVEVEKMLVVRLARRFLPLSSKDEGDHFIVRENGRLKFTLLFLVLIVVEMTDLIFALDSIPAIFGVTRDPFIVYTSNVCAILGLRSLYFLLAGAVKSLVYLHVGLACVLIFIGGKMVIEGFYPVSTEISLIVVGGILGVAVAASLMKTKFST